MTLEEFISKNLGHMVDYDGAYGAQCVDLFRQYAKDVWGIKEHLGPVEGAKDLFLKHEELPVQRMWLRRVKKAAPKVGDVLVWKDTPSNKWGHVAICIARNNEHVCVFEQNGFTQQGAFLGWRRLDQYYLGALRRR